MASVYNDVDLYQNQGALLGLGSNQIVSFSNFQTPTSGHLRVEDTDTDFNWDVGETAQFQGQAATLTAAGTAVAGVTLQIPLLINVTVQLSSPVLTGVVTVNGVQYVRFFDAAGNDVEPAALLDGLVSQLTAAVGPVLLPAVLATLGVDLATFVETNALLNFNLSTGGSVDLIPCFTAGTLIMTSRGEVRVEKLAVGDLVLTVDHGLQPIRWIGSRCLDAAELRASPHLLPIHIAAGALGDSLPTRKLIVSPQHRCLVSSIIAERMFGEREVLVAAKHLLDAPGVSIASAAAGVTYLHLLFDRHELVVSNGAVTESFYPGDQALSAVDQAARDEILEIFPDILARDRPPAPARTFIRGRVARRLVSRSVANRKPLVELAQTVAQTKGLAAGRG